MKASASFRAVMETQGIHDKTFDLAQDATIAPRIELRDSVEAELENLPRIDVGSIGSEAGLAVECTLGTGGMGVVRQATQRSLIRRVAVKTVRPDVATSEASQKLLREAWITGRLEHPNIIPIYALGKDDHGHPVLVMKRVDGVPWDQVIGDAQHPRLDGVADPLRWHLDVLLDVCNALELAHARGVIHRDIKPENIMIGEFGEVYLLDWGIAVTIGDEPGSRLPRAEDVAEIAGTPAYMAPEMVQVGYAPIDVRTDVYLLGSTLYEILAGSAPHQGDAVMDVLCAAYESEPAPLPSDTHRELVELTRSAMARRPEDRPASVKAFRESIQAYLDHRSSLELSDQAGFRLLALESLVGGEAGDESPFRLFSEARFGFEQALRVWPDNEVARDGLRQTLEVMAAHEIKHGALVSAENIIAEIGDPPPRLVESIEALRERLKSEEEQNEKLRQLEFNRDLSIGQTARFRGTLLMALVWAAIPLLVFLLAPAMPDQVQVLHAVGITFVYGASILVGAWVQRESILRTAINRQIVGASLVAFFSMLGSRGAALILDISFETVATFDLLAFGVVLAMLTIFVDVRLWWGALAYFVATVMAAFMQPYVLLVMAGANLIGLLSAALAWAPGRMERRPRPLRAHPDETRKAARAHRTFSRRGRHP